MSWFSVVPTTIPNIPGFTSGGTVVPPNGFGSSGVTVQNGTSSVGGLATIVGILLAFLGVLAVLSLVGVLVIIIVANRADPDPKGRRPQSVYYFAVSFVTLSLAIFGSAVVVSGVVAFVGNHSNAVMNAAAPRSYSVGSPLSSVSCSSSCTCVAALRFPAPTARSRVRRNV